MVSILSNFLLRRPAPLFRHHSYGVRRTYLSAYPATLTIFQIHFNRDGLADNSFGTVQPALKTGGFVFPGWRTLLVVYQDRKSTRLNSSHGYISYAVFCLKKK